jgi:hypothetical protein
MPRTGGCYWPCIGWNAERNLFRGLPTSTRVSTGRSDGGLAAESAIGGFEAFVGSNFGRLLRRAYLLTNDPALAEELVQLTLKEVRAAWPGINGDPHRHVREVMPRVLARLSRDPSATGGPSRSAGPGSSLHRSG